MTTIPVTILADRCAGPMPHPERTWATSLRVVPTEPVLTRAVAAFGRPRLVRIWAILDEYWDYRDDSFHPDHVIGANRYGDDPRMFAYDRGVTRESTRRYRSYLDGVGSRADELMLCFRRYEKEVVRGVITLARYEAMLERVIRDVKERLPHLRWVEALNEPEAPIFGGLDADQYYRLYQATYRAVARINADHLPGPGLLVGGPATATEHLERLPAFLARHAADPDAAKRLDFISHHDYSSAHRPLRIGELRACLDGWISAYGLPKDLPVFLTELGLHEELKRGNQRMAAGVSTLLQQACRHRLTCMPWCLHHDPELQMGATMVLADGRLTAYGAMMAMLALHGTDEVPVVHAGTDEIGLGLHVWASRHADGRIVVQVWNYAGIWGEHPPLRARISVAGPARRPAGHYRIDDRISNCLANPASPGLLERVADPERSADGGWEVELPRDALASFVLEPRP